MSAEEFKKIVEVSLARKGWTKAKLAESMGVTPGYVQDLINGTRNSEFRKNQIKELLKDSWGA